MFSQRLSICGTTAPALRGGAAICRTTAPALRGGAVIATVLALGLGLAPQAQAQGTGGTGGSNTSSSGRIRVTLISIGGRQVNSIGQIYLDGQECEDNASLLFKIDYAPKDKPTIDIYTGQSCNNTDRKSTTVNSCTYLPPPISTGGVTMGLMVKVKAQDLVVNCSTPQEAKPKLWFLAVSSPGSSEAVNNDYGLFDRLEIDTNPPSAPIGVSSSEGEHLIPVSWSGGQTNLKGFKVYIDPNPGAEISATTTTGGGGNGGATDTDMDAGSTNAGVATVDAGAIDSGVVMSTTVTPDDAGASSDGGIGATNPACASLYLRAGADPNSLPDGLRVKEVNEPTGTGVDLHPADIGSKHAAVAVVSVDLAGNESVLSNVACLDVVRTTDFWDRFVENGGEPTSGCACSTVGAAQLQSAWPVALAMLGLSLSAKRRRKS